MTKRKLAPATACVLALHSIGRKMRHRKVVPFTDVEAIKESQAANYCMVLEVMFGAGYKANKELGVYEAPQ